MMHSSKIITFSPPLPCGTIDPEAPDGVCGKPATVGHATPAPLTRQRQPQDPAHLAGAGEWVILPVCRDCALATLAIYEMDKPNTQPAAPATLRVYHPDGSEGPAYVY